MGGERPLAERRETDGEEAFLRNAGSLDSARSGHRPRRQQNIAKVNCDHSNPPPGTAGVRKYRVVWLDREAGM